MKKVISLLLAAVMLAAWMAVPAAAAEPVQVSVSDASAKRGDTVTVSVSVSETVCATWMVTVTYDADALELVSFQSADPAVFSEVSTGRISKLGWEDAVTAGELFTVTFKVLADGGAHTVGVQVDNFTMADTTKLDSAVKSGTVTVTREDVPDDDETTAVPGTQPPAQDPVETVPQPSGAVPEETPTDAAGEATGEVTGEAPTVEPTAASPTAPGAENDETAPDPGEATPGVLWPALLVVCAIGAAVVIVCLRKKRNT